MQKNITCSCIQSSVLGLQSSGGSTGHRSSQFNKALKPHGLYGTSGICRLVLLVLTNDSYKMVTFMLGSREMWARYILKSAFYLLTTHVNPDYIVYVNVSRYLITFQPIYASVSRVSSFIGPSDCTTVACRDSIILHT